MEYWNPKIECLSAEELKQLQERKLSRRNEDEAILCLAVLTHIPTSRGRACADGLSCDPRPRFL
jgi:hypothetical protein